VARFRAHPAGGAAFEVGLNFRAAGGKAFETVLNFRVAAPSSAAAERGGGFEFALAGKSVNWVYNDTVESSASFCHATPGGWPGC